MTEKDESLKNETRRQTDPMSVSECKSNQEIDRKTEKGKAPVLLEHSIKSVHLVQLTV